MPNQSIHVDPNEPFGSLASPYDPPPEAGDTCPIGATLVHRVIQASSRLFPSLARSNPLVVFDFSEGEPSITTAATSTASVSKSHNATKSGARSYHEVLYDYCLRHDFVGMAMTLTFRPSRNGVLLTEEIARSTVNHFLRALDRKAFGRAQSNTTRLQAIVVMEGGVGRNIGKRIHYHLKVELPESWDAQAFTDICEGVWTKLDWASNSQNCFKPQSDVGWISYILKHRDKPDYARAFDWELARINTEGS